MKNKSTFLAFLSALLFAAAANEGRAQTTTNAVTNGGSIGSGVTAIITNPVTSTTGNITNSGSLQFWQTGSLSAASAISGSGQLVQAGTGTTTLSGANTFTGPVSIDAGTLRLLLGSGGVPSLTGDTTINSGGTLLLGQGDTIGDSRAVTVNGGTFNLGGFADSMGVVTLISGTITNGTLAGSAYNLQSGTVSAVMANRGGVGITLTKDTTNTVILTGANTYTGGTVINAGTLQIGNGGTTGTLGSGALTNNGTLAVNRSDTFWLSNSISGTGQLVQNGGYTLLAATNMATGGTVINAGTLQLGIVSTNLLADNAPLTVNGGTFALGGNSETVGAVTLAGGTITNGTLTGSSYDVRSGTVLAVLAGSAALTKSTAGTTTLSGANSYTGGTTINAGTLALGAANRLADTGAVTVNAGSFDLGGFSDTVGAVTLAGGSIANGTLTGSSYDMQSGSVSAALAGNAALTKNAAGTVTLTGGNSYTGGTLINAGTLQLGNGGTGGTVSGAITNNATLAINRVDAGGTTVANNISGTGAVILNTGRSTQTAMTGSNTFSGGLTVNDTTLLLTADRQLGASNGAITLNGGQLNNNGTVMTIGAGRTINLTTNGGFLGAGWGTNLTIQGSITGAGPLGIASQNGVVVLAGSNSYTGPTTIGATNAPYWWNTASQGTTLRLANANALPTGTELVFASNPNNNLATLDLNGFSLAPAGLNGGANARVQNGAAGAVTLSVGTNNASGTFAGIIGGGSGTISLVKTGTGTQILSGANTYTGGTLINEGTLRLNDGTLGSGNITNNATLISGGGSTITLANTISGTGALVQEGSGITTLSGSNPFTGAVTINNGTLRLNSSNALANAAGVFFGASNTPTLELNSAVNSGIINVNGGLNGGTNARVTRGTVFNTGPTLAVNVASNTTANFAGVISDGSSVVSFIKNGAGTQIFSGANTYQGTTTINAGTLALGGSERIRDNTGLIVSGGTFDLGGFNETVGYVTLTSGSIVNGTLTNGNQNGPYDVRSGTASAVLAGSAALTKTTTNTVVLSGNNTYSGGTTNSAGTLQIGDGGASGTLGTGSVANNATLVINRNNAYALSNAISGSGSLVHVGTGTVTLSGANTYTGGTTVNAGRLATAGNERLADTGAVTVNSNATFAIGGNETVGSLAGNGAVVLGERLTTGASSSTFGGVMSGIGGLTKSGAGTFTLSGANTYAGDTILSGGTLVLNNANALWNGGVLSMDAGTTLTVNQRTFIGALDQNGGTINGSGQLVATLTLTESGALNAVIADGPDFAAGILKRTAGTTTIGAANTFTGAVNVQGGTLQLGAGGSFDAASSLALSAGATMDLGNKAQTFTSVSGAGGTVAVGSGALTVNGSYDSEFAGAITGTGSFTKAGSGSVTLSGTSSYTGGTTVNAGTLALGAANRLADSGAVTVNAGSFDLGGFSDTVGAVTLAGGSIANGTLTGSSYDLRGGNVSAQLASSGVLTKTGAGTVTLSGANTYTGGTTIAAGTLQVGNGGTSGSLGSGAVTNNAAMIFNRSDDTTVANLISGTGSVVKTGAGNMTLSGTSTYSGATTVSSGGLLVSGSIASSAVTVQSGAFLGGSGTVGSLTVRNGGTVSPGNSPGTLNINGDIDWLGGGSYNWQIVAATGAAGTSWDLLSAAGQLDLAALTVSSKFNINLLTLGSGTDGALADFIPNQSYTWTILTATNGISGFAANKFNINTAGFANTLAPGWGFSVVEDGGNLNLVYGSTAIPEPGTWAAAALLVGGAALMRWRQRRGVVQKKSGHG